MSKDEHLSDREILLGIRHDVKSLITAKDDHETRLRFIERFSAVLSGGIGLSAFLLGLFVRSHKVQ